MYGKGLSSKGTIPYVRLDDETEGKEINDSNIILQQIQKALKQREDDHGMFFSESKITASQRAMTHMLIRMLEEHSIQINFYYRYGLHIDEFL